MFTGAGRPLGPASGGGNEHGKDEGVEGVDTGVKPEGLDTSANCFRRIKGTARGHSNNFSAYVPPLDENASIFQEGWD